MSAWSVITARSTAPYLSTAWTHLNNQSIIGGLQTASVQLSLSANKLQALSANAGKTLTTHISNKQLTAKINISLEASLCQS